MSNELNAISADMMEDEESQAIQCVVEEVSVVDISGGGIMDPTRETDVNENSSICEDSMEGASCLSAGADSPDIEVIETYQSVQANTSSGPKTMETKILKRLEVNNPKFMKDFDPERSQREARKLEKLPGSAAAEKKSKRRNPNRKYDARGLLIGTGEDLCDCLIDDCPGCHFPCPKCRSCKCGHACRRNRVWVYDEIEVEGTGEVIRRNPK